MRPVHYITIAVAVLLIVFLYIGGNTVPPKSKDAPLAGAANGQHSVTPASFDTLLVAARRQLPEHALEEVRHLEDKISAISDSSQMAVVFDTLAGLWMQHKKPKIAAYYYLQEAELVNSEKKLTFAAQLFLQLARRADSESEQAWLGQQAIEGFKKALAINPGNDSTKVLLAECYIGTGATMEGVLLLRDVTEKDPDNIEANLVLGQQGIISGQLEKAIGRFERVLKKEPNNIEAMLGMAEAYKNRGDKQKAIALLEEAKKLMNNPEFDKDVDDYIKTFR